MKIFEIFKKISSIEECYITGVAALTLQNLMPHGAWLRILDIITSEDCAGYVNAIKKELKSDSDSDLEINIHLLYRRNVYELKDFFDIKLKVAKSEIAFIDSIIMEYDLSEIILPGLEEALYNEQIDREFMLRYARGMGSEKYKKIKHLIDFIEPERLRKMDCITPDYECTRTCGIIAREFNTSVDGVIGAIQESLNAY